MNKNYRAWEYSIKGNRVFPCKNDCVSKNLHFIGNYEDALVFFTGTTDTADNNKHYGDLFNVIIAHQTDPKFVTKTSAELYSILMQAAATPKYWVPKESRRGKVISLLEEAEEKGYMHDKEILIENENKSALKQRRQFKQEIFNRDLKN